MRNILVVSERFAPENTVGAIRMTKISKFLKEQMECRVTVVTRKKTELDQYIVQDLKHIDEWIYVEEGWLCKKLIETYKKYSGSEKYKSSRRVEIEQINKKVERQGTCNRIKIGIRSIIAIIWSEFTARSYSRVAMKKLYDTIEKYDVIITSFGPEASHYIGRAVKKRNPKVAWIADYRDPLYSGEATKGFLSVWAKSFAKRVTKNADAITVVSNGFIRCLCLDDWENVYVVTNGYDEDDLEQISGKTNIKTEKMVFAYVGSLLVGRRDIIPILCALKELIQQGKICADDISISYAGSDKNEFIIQTNQVGLNVSMDVRDSIPKEEALQLQKNADVLMLAAWNTEQYTGSLPLKLFEYMLMNKRILCVVSGNSGDSEIKGVIERCGIGCCYEEVYKQKDYECLKKYIMLCYEEYKQGMEEQTERIDNLENVSQYSYRSITSQFIEIIKTIEANIKGNRGYENQSDRENKV